MSFQTNQNPFEQIKSRLSVVDVIGRYLNLGNNGQNYKAVCPFHNEKHPSLVVSPIKDIWHCFGCGVGGDIFKFVQMFENTDKAGALRILAKQCNLVLDLPKKLSPQEVQTSQKQIDTYTRGLKYLHWTAQIYHNVLQKLLQDSTNPITIYCKKRGWDLPTIHKFELGYAPSGNFILNLAKKHNLDLDLLAEIGVFSTFGSSLDLKDKFVDRLMVPVFDKTSQVVGFTGRVLPNDTKLDRPKYLNSSQSIWFNKSELWYGWNLNSTRIRQQKKAIIVEGNMDVIKSNQCGFDYTLASQGTSFTTEQLKILKSLTDTVWLAFDNDTAGVTSSVKFFEQATKLGFMVFKVVIPTSYKDIDEYFSAGNKDFRTIPFLDYYFDFSLELLQSDDSVVATKSIRSCLDLLTFCDKITQEQYLNKLSKFCKISFSTLQTELVSKISKIPQTNSAQQKITTQNTITKTSTTQQTLNDFNNLLIQTNLEDGRLNNLFLLLRTLIVELKEFGSLLEYFEANRQELELISENTLEQNETNKNETIYNKDISSTQKLWQILDRYIDRNVSKFLFDKSMSRIYADYKATKLA
jgi:DNA primase